MKTSYDVNDRIRIRFKSGSVHGGATEGIVTIAQVQADRIWCRWPDLPDRLFIYRLDEIQVLEVIDQ